MLNHFVALNHRVILGRNSWVGPRVSEAHAAARATQLGTLPATILLDVAILITALSWGIGFLSLRSQPERSTSCSDCVELIVSLRLINFRVAAARLERTDFSYALRVTTALMPIASKISWSRAIATVW
jgi:hypothetical protein